MTVSAELEQRIEVRSSFRGMTRGYSIPCIARLMRDIERRVSNNSAKTIRRIGEEVGTVARYEQHAGIVHYRAIFTRNLFDSIQSKKEMATKDLVKYKVATTINKPYPVYLIKGRKAVTPVNKKVLRFKLTPKGEYLFRPRVKASKPKNYVAFADKHLQPLIPGMVRRYVGELFR